MLRLQTLPQGFIDSLRIMSNRKVGCYHFKGTTGLQTVVDFTASIFLFSKFLSNVFSCTFLYCVGLLMLNRSSCGIMLKMHKGNKPCIFSEALRLSAVVALFSAIVGILVFDMKRKYFVWGSPQLRVCNAIQPHNLSNP